MESSVSTPESLVESALSLLEAGDVLAAEARCRRALAINPRRCATSAVLGLLLQSAARHSEAEELFLDLTQREPHEVSHWVNLGTARRGMRRLDDALAAYSRAAALGAMSADFFYNVGLTHLDRLDYDSARAVLERARALAPQDAEIRVQLARSCELLLRTDEALGALEGWFNLKHLTGDLLAIIAQLFFSLRDPAQGEAAMRRALASTDVTTAGLLMVVGTLERINRMAQAESLMKRIDSLARAPSVDGEALIARAQLAQRAANHDIACRLYRDAAAACVEERDRHFALFPLARSLDALGRHDDAYATLIEAHASQAAYLKLAAPLESLRGPPPMVVTEFGCDPADVVQWREGGAPSAADSPIFIVAFPRSGTTLLEVALDAHPSVKGMDEQPFVQNALDEMLAAGIDYPRGLAQLPTRELDAIRDRYWARARRKAGVHPGDRLLDKNPLNILRLPVIRRLFPHARIVLATRHPCDVLMSCFMQHFRAPDFALLCQSLLSVARGYRRTLDFWYAQVAALEPAVYELRYEALVTTFEKEMRVLCEFLALPWHAAVLEPGEHARRKGYISTPSYAQVVNPISGTAVGRWRNYEQHFEEVLPIVAPYLRRWAYEP